MIYALGDLHLGHSVDKPMDIFGPQWENHSMRIAESWRRTVDSDDLVLIPGDISWAMNLREAQADLSWIGELPGAKILIRGNHDYWWTGIGKVRSALPQNTNAIQNDSIMTHGYAICGSRGWLVPSHPQFSDEDDIVYRREGERLRMSLETARKSGRPILVMMHYPPCAQPDDDTVFTRLLQEYEVVSCIYGHLHGTSHRFAIEGIHSKVFYQLVSADYVGFSPTPILGIDQGT